MNSWPSCRIIEMLVPLVAFFAIVVRPCPADEPSSEEWVPPDLELKVCGSNDWLGRAGVFLGPQYYLETDDEIQFSFGLEGNLRMVGPLSAGLALGAGVVADTNLEVQAGLRLDLVRNCLLSLALDARGGIIIVWPGDGARVEPVVAGGLELVHDLGKLFYIQVRTSAGYLFSEKRGWFLDLIVGVGVFF